MQEARHNPGLFRDTLERAREVIREMEELRVRDPELFKVRLRMVEIHRAEDELVDALKDCKDEEKRKALREKLKRVVSEAFDLKMREHKRRIEALEEELRRLKEMHKRHKEHRDRIIERRVRRLLGEEDDEFDW